MPLEILQGAGNCINAPSYLPTTSPTNEFIPITLTLNNSKWIYCNAEEKIKTATASNGMHLNRVTVSSGTHQLFYSYFNETGGNKFGIQISNPNAGAISFTINKYGHAQGNDFHGVAKNSWVNFFNSTPSATQTIPSNGKIWVCENTMPTSAAQPFSGILNFTVTNNAIVTAYAYSSTSSVPAITEPFKQTVPTPKMWSGYGDGYLYTSSRITIDAKDLVGKNKFFYLATKTSEYFPKVGSTIKSDIIPLYGVNTVNGVTTKGPSADDNLGNWGVQYDLLFDFKNSLETEEKTINLYVRPATAYQYDNHPIFNYKGTVYGFMVGPSTPATAWKFARIKIPAKTTTAIQETIQHIIGTNGSPGNLGSTGHIIYFSLT